jgi:Mrp family chromosome partitioning ATPase
VRAAAATELAERTPAPAPDDAGETGVGDEARVRPTASHLTRRSVEMVRDAVQPTTVPDLFVLPAGTPVPNPAELLVSRKAAAVLEELSRRADIVVFDTPPVLAVADALILSARADGVVLVTALGRTFADATAHAAEMLSASKVRVLGTVVNRPDDGGAKYYGYAGYYSEDAEARAGA